MSSFTPFEDKLDWNSIFKGSSFQQSLKFKVKGEMASHINSMVKHNVGTLPYFPPRCLWDVCCRLQSIILSVFYLANTVAEMDLLGLWKFENGTKLLGRTQAVSVL